MRRIPFSIRTVLLLVIGLLNVLIAAPLGVLTYQAALNYQNARQIEHVAEGLERLYNVKKFLSLERAATYSLLDVPSSSFAALKEQFQESRAKGHEAYESALEYLGHEDTASLPSLGAVRESYAGLQALRLEMQALSLKPRMAGKTTLPDRYFRKTSELIEDINLLIEEYSRRVVLFNPNVTRQMRLTRLMWEISEYAGQEYAILGRLIAQNRFPDLQTREALLTLRGRIQYGLEIAHGAVESNAWRDKLAPSLEEAETHYIMIFEQIKDIFSERRGVPGDAIYPVTVEMWLQLASEAVGSMYNMTDTVLETNALNVSKVAQGARNFIGLSIFLFLASLALSLYSWRLINRRVIRPINGMVEALYKETRLSARALQGGSLDEVAKLEQVLEVFRDNAHRLQRETEKAQAASIAKSEFLANMSHEIRTPMNVVVGLSHILARTEPLTDKQAQFIRTLEVSAESLLALINDLLDFSKIEAQNFELEQVRFYLDQLVADLTLVTSFKCKEKGLDFKVEITGIEGKEYLGDPTRIRQILVNLCSNAAKFTEHGSVHLEIQSCPSRSGDHETIKIKVTDTGIGISPDKIEAVFEKFTQADASVVRKYGGTGLGLTITKSLVEMMGGKIEVESRVGEGTSFFVSLPLRLKAQQNLFMLEDIRKTPHDELEKGKVLLVEDYRPNAIVAETLLEEFGYDYDTASDGNEALLKYMENHYDVILMDVQMPVMDGLQATRAIRKYEKDNTRPPVRIIGLTAHASTRDKDKCFQAGMDDYLAKPFEGEILREKLANF